MNRRDKLILFAMSHAAAKNSEQCNAAVDAIERQLDSAQAQARATNKRRAKLAPGQKRNTSGAQVMQHRVANTCNH